MCEIITFPIRDQLYRELQKETEHTLCCASPSTIEGMRREIERLRPLLPENDPSLKLLHYLVESMFITKVSEVTYLAIMHNAEWDRDE